MTSDMGGGDVARGAARVRSFGGTPGARGTCMNPRVSNRGTGLRLAASMLLFVGATSSAACASPFEDDADSAGDSVSEATAAAVVDLHVLDI